MKLTALDKIREQYGGQPPQYCPLCRHKLTIELTHAFKTSLCENCFEHAEIEELERCCDKQDLQYVKYIVEGGSIQVRQQCASCGWCSGNSFGGFTKEERQKMPSIDDLKRLQAQDRKYQFRKEFLNGALTRKADRKKKLWFEEYNKYLQSPEWREKRDLVLKRDNYKCQCCLDALATQVHHKSYMFVDLKGGEPAFDLVAICTPCHEKIETKKREMK
jgi:5-methylcytosine-specific restriction endonuclease McrA